MSCALRSAAVVLIAWAGDLAGCRVLGLEALPCAEDGDCFANERCFDRRCLKRRSGEGEEGEGEGEGEGEIPIPAARWRLDEASGGTLFEDIAGVHAVLGGSAARVNDGPLARGVRFTGGVAAANYAPFEDLGLASFSIAVVMRLDDDTDGRVVFIGDRRDRLDPFELSVRTGGGLSFRLESETTRTSIDAPPVEFGVFHSVVAVYDDTGEASLYIDAVRMASGFVTFVPSFALEANSAAFTLGNSEPPSQFPSHVTLNDAQVFRAALSQAQIEALAANAGF